ncbi:hypothetical protein ACJX0J_011985, partial [Zea mays]
FVYMYTNKFEQKGFTWHYFLWLATFWRLASMASDNIIYFIKVITCQFIVFLCILDTFLLRMDRMLSMFAKLIRVLGLGYDKSPQKDAQWHKLKRKVKIQGISGLLLDLWLGVNTIDARVGK